MSIEGGESKKRRERSVKNENDQKTIGSIEGEQR